MRIKQILKKTLAVVLTFAMLAPIMANLDISVVQAEEINLSEVLSVKCQVTNGIVTNTNIDKYCNKYVMRFVSSIENLEYTYVGFEVSYTDENGQVITKTNKTKKVFNRIESTTGSTANGKDEYSFGPKVISADSEYLITAKLPVAIEDITEDYTVRAFGIKTNGQTVYGPKRCVSVEDGLTDKSRINVSVNKALDETASYTATYTNASGQTVTIDSTNVKVLPTEDGQSTVRLLNTDKNMKSLTEITIKDASGKIVATPLYRNLYTKYDKADANTVDTSWYEVADSEETEFIIATSADLYGLAHLANEGDANGVPQQFSGKRIYLASDIVVNDETLVTDGTDTSNYNKWYTYTEDGERNYSNTPTNTWTPIGSAGNPFDGNFDGNMHSISGIYLNSSSNYSGLFGVTGADSTIQQLYIKNSYITSSGTGVGSVAGQGRGTFSKIFSDAIVVGTNAAVGGLIGRGNGKPLEWSECWYDGTVTNTSPSALGTGGLVGDLYQNTQLKIKDCLNSGSVDVINSTKTVPFAGGLVGYVYTGAKLTIEDSLIMSDVLSEKITGVMVGGTVGAEVEVTSSYGYGTSATEGIVGWMQTQSKLTVNYYNEDKSEMTKGPYTNPASGAAGKNIALAKEAALFLDKTSVTSLFGSIKGADAGTNLPGLDFDTIWSTIPNRVPVLTSFETEVIDYSWYDEDADTYTLYDKADLYGFAALSQDTDFANKTITLGNDIILNNGDSAKWATSAPKYVWTPIGSAELPFDGNFDGNMHSISGIYMNSSTAYSGLFGVTGANSTIQQLYIKNSYITSSANGVGSVAGQGRGAFSKIFSDAIVVGSKSFVGGLIGLVNGKPLEMSECWYDGTVTNTFTTKEYRGTGGLVGDVLANTQLKIKNCLNSGLVDVTAQDYLVPSAGGLVGNVNTGADVTIEDSLNLSAVSALSGKLPGVLVGCVVGAKLRATTSYGYGTADTDSIVGWMQDESTFLIDYYYPKDTFCKDVDRSTGQGSTSLTSSYRKIPAMFINKTELKSILGSIKGADASTNLPGLDFEYIWQTVDDATPVLRFSKEVDMSWYNESKDTYVLYDKADLYGFAVLSQNNDFAGKTVQLGRDIVVNVGLAKNWESTAPQYSWTPISNATTPFAGTFDGQGHTIYGLYSKTTTLNTGLFSVVGSSGIVQNIKLVNSYFESSGKNLGSIAGLSYGKFYMIYSDAEVSGASQNNGGILGTVSGSDSVLENCWFNGRVSGFKATAGLVGLAYDDSSESEKLILRNCFNTGVVDATAHKVTNPSVGGIIGWKYDFKDIHIDSCVSAGVVLYSEDATSCYGPIIGYNSDLTDSITIANTYVTHESCECDNEAGICQSLSLSHFAATYNHVNVADVKKDAETCMPLLGWGEDWKMVENSLPEIIFSNTGFGEQADYVAKETDVTMLNALYSNRALLQGDLHAHAKTLSQKEDGTVSLSAWKEQMVTSSYDFAASFDHKQTGHINATEWEKSKFIYGTEAGGAILVGNQGNGSNRIHYNMIFRTKAEMENVLKAFSEFNYDSETGTFDYDYFVNRERFTNLIQKVMDENGFFVIPHPHATYETFSGEMLPFSTKAEDYYFVDGVGLEVISINYAHEVSETNYRTWTELLNMTPSKRIYACSGSDTHADLTESRLALTSIYAPTCSGDCTDDCADTGCAKSDKGNMIPSLRNGNFTAGAVGIQMCIGDSTSMGGSCDFSNKRLVVRVGALHRSFQQESIHRVDILNENGIVYSQQTTFDDNTVIALDTEDCKYYRVEVYNVATGARVAIGNPIWNDK